MSVRFVLVRHGESVWNEAGIVQGHHGPGLTARGHEQARVTADAIAREHADAVLVVRSDLPRVAETAARIERVLGVPARVDDRLREIDMGSWSGKTWTQIADHDPGGLDRWRGGEDIARGGGETYAGLQERVWAALRDLVVDLDRHDGAGPGPTVVLVTHGGPIRVAVAAALGIPGEGWRAVDAVDNCSLTILDVPGVDGRTPGRLVGYNRVGHLSPHLATTEFTDA